MENTINMIRGKDEFVDIRARKMANKLHKQKQHRINRQRILDNNKESSEGLHPLERFPKEIWMMILSLLRPEDKYTMWETHSLFSELMEPTRIQDILFPLLLQVDTFEKFMRESEDGFSFERLRRVSKSIKKSYDFIMDTKTEKWIDDFLYADFNEPGVLCLEVGVKKHHQVLKTFLSNFSSNSDTQSVTGFPFRAVHISFGTLYQDITFENGQSRGHVFNEFVETLLKFLEVIGNRFWGLELSFSGIEFENTSTQIYILLHRLVSRTLNLKWLAVGGLEALNIQEEDVNFVRIYYPFPKLADLKRLTFWSPTYNEANNNSSFNIHEMILYAQSNQHNIKTLEFAEFGLKKEVKDACHFNSLLQLVHSLPLTGLQLSNGDYTTSMQLENIVSLMNFDWQLQSICLSLDHTEPGTFGSMTALLQFLNKFPTLEVILLNQLKRFKFETTESLGFLKVSNLKVFQLELTAPILQLGGNIHSFFSLQFLLYCKKLRTLAWKMTNVKDDLQNYLRKHENANSLDFRGGCRNVYESKIWEVFPDLKTVVVELEVYRHNSNPCDCTCIHEYCRSQINTTFQQYMKVHECNIDYCLQHCVHHKRICLTSPSPCLNCFYSIKNRT